MPIDPPPQSPLDPGNRDAPPINVQPLEYYSPPVPPPDAAKVVPWTQFCAGLILLNVLVVLVTVVALRLGGVGGLILNLSMCLGFVALSGFLQTRMKWTAFVPGVLTGFLLAPVSFFFACASQLFRA